MKRVFIIAGDSSGDLHASKLMKELKNLNSEIEFFGIGGDLMINEGLDSLVWLSEISVVGFWEVAKKYSFFKKIIKQVEEQIEKLQIDIFIAVDFPGFNQRIAKFAKEKGIPVVWYIAPQLWAWGEHRALKLSKIIDDLLVVFPFEEEFFENYGIRTHFVGHPLLDIPEFQNANLSLENREKKILLMPGSRKQEIKSHISLMKELHKLIHQNFQDFQTVMALPQSLISSVSHEINGIDKIIVSNNSRDEMLTARAGVIKSGTSNLEACIAGLPFVMFYKTSALTYLLGKKMINLNFLSLVNILAEKNIVMEMIQKNANPKQIFEELEKLIYEQDYSQQMVENLVEIRNYLGRTGASLRAAELINNSYFK